LKIRPTLFAHFVFARILTTSNLTFEVKAGENDFPITVTKPDKK
jgi:hypothetical protein